MSLGSGGAERQMCNLAIDLQEKNYEVSFSIVNEASIFYKEYLLNHNISVFNQNICFSNNKAFLIIAYLKMIFSLVRYIRKKRIDTVITFLPIPNFVACIASVFVKFNLIIGERSADIKQFRSGRGVLFAKLNKRASYIVCNSENARNMWMEFYPEFADKLVVIYNSIELRKAKENKYPNPQQYKLLVAASIQDVKNPLAFIKALSLLDKDEQSKLKIDWYGDHLFNDGLYERCLSKLEEYSLSDFFEFHPATTDIYSKMLDADAVCLFSKYEGLPNAICEALSLGKCVIMTKVSDYKTLVTKDNGLLCDDPSAEGIRSALSRFCKLTPDEIMAMGRRSEVIASSLFSKNTNLNKWISLI